MARDHTEEAIETLVDLMRHVQGDGHGLAIATIQ
jgi:hypothetical protein